MSLVEQALRKIQAQAQKAEPPASVEQAVPVPAAQAQAKPVATGLSVIAQRTALALDHLKFRACGMLPPIDQERTVARQLRAIKHGLLRKMAADAPAPQLIPRTIMVASAVPGDGKTFSALNLALSLAMEKDLSVLLVDADVLKPQMTIEFGLAEQVGLIDVLADPAADIVDCVRPTQVRGLYFLPAGQRSEVATELLSSERMASVVKRLVNLQSDLLVVFDSSPLLLTAEAVALAGVMSQILLVVRAGVTPQPAVQQTIQMLAGDGDRISLMLNDARESDAASYTYGSAYDGVPRQSK